MTEIQRKIVLTTQWEMEDMICIDSII